MTETQLVIAVPNTELEVVAYMSGDDLVIVINGPSGCLGRLVIEELCSHDLRHARIGDHRLMREASP